MSIFTFPFLVLILNVRWDAHLIPGLCAGITIFGHFLFLL